LKHEEAWTLLPDLLDDRDDAGLLAHVRACSDCQRQLFLLGRVDRLLRDDAAMGTLRKRRRLVGGLSAAAAAVAAASVAALLLLFQPEQRLSEGFVLQTASGRSVGEAVMAHSDARNASLALKAHDLPVSRGQMFVLWASDDRSSMVVGRFMVDRTGGCRVRFNLPDTHAWNRFWVTRPGSAAAVATSA
jgi:hypothetical protein